MNKEIQKIKPSGIFTNYIYKTIPLAFDESMSYYETLCGLLSYLKDTVIPTLNNNADAIIELQNLYKQLHDYVEHYFDNLDVQQEINNKLDDMVKQGILQEIIADYLDMRAVFAFNNVQSMKEATNLKNGSYAETYGFYQPSDGGGSKYLIRQITNQDIIDEMTKISLYDKNLIAILIINDSIKPEQLGAKHDNINDDSDYLIKCINILNNNNGGTIELTNNYIIAKEIDISNSSNIIFNGNGKGTLTKPLNNDTNIFFGDNTTNIKFINLKFEGNRRETLSSNWPHTMNACAILRYGINNSMENCEINNFWYGVCLSTSNNSKNTHINACKFSNNNSDIDLYGKPIVSITNNSSKNCTGNSIQIEPIGEAHEDIYDYNNETNIDSLSINNIIKGNSIDGCHDIAINISSGSINTIITENTITNCSLGIYLYHLECKNIIVSNNVISNITGLRDIENGRPYYNIGCGIVICSNIYGANISNNIIDHARCGIGIIGSSSAHVKNYLVNNNVIQHCLTSGISVYYGENISLMNNFFKDNCLGSGDLYWYQNSGIHLYGSSDIYCSNNATIETRTDTTDKQAACVYIGQDSTNIAINNCISKNTRYGAVYPNNANLNDGTNIMTSPFTSITNAS